MPAPNERFCESGALTPQKVPCEHERKYPAERSVSAAASPSRCLVVRQRREHCREEGTVRQTLRGKRHKRKSCNLII